MSDNYQVTISPAARRVLAEALPEKVAAAAWELIQGQLRAAPHRVGRPLRAPFERQHVARRSTYRVFYRIDDARGVVTILAIKPRGDAYRADAPRGR